MDISIVIPVYNSENTLEKLVERLTVTLNSIGGSYEIILINDGSSDKSWEILSRLHKSHKSHMQIIQLMRNFGQHNALMCGFHHAQGEVIITMDDDLQNPPEEIPKMLNSIKSRQLDLVYGVPHQKQHKKWRNIGSSIIRSFYRIVFNSYVYTTSFRIIRRDLVKNILSYDLNYTYIDGLLAWCTQKVGQVEVEHHARSIGSSGYSLGKLILLALNLFTNFSLIPLQVVSIIGFFTAIGGLIGGIYYFVIFLTKGISVPGYASIIIAILILGGLQLLALGILGEYLGRVHLNINRKPQYIERRVVSKNQ